MASTLSDLPGQSVAADHPLAAAQAVRTILDAATQLLRDRRTPRMWSEEPSRVALERVARIGDELHVTANRVARFGVDEHPRIDPVRVKAPVAATAVLGPARLLHQLELSVFRLAKLLSALSTEQWEQRGRIGDEWVSLAEVVHGVVDDALVDLSDLLDAQRRWGDAAAS